MQTPLNAILKAVALAISVAIIMNVLGFIYNVEQINNYETQVSKYIQTAGGVTPAVIKKADKLSKTNYHGYLKLVANGSGPVTKEGKKSYQAVYPTEWSTDYDRVPIYPNLKKQGTKKLPQNTNVGALMSLLDHPGKLFAGKPKQFTSQNEIPSGIKASAVREIKPIGYLDKNYFFTNPSTKKNNVIGVYPYELSNPRNLVNQHEPLQYKWTKDRRESTNLWRIKINPQNAKVHFKNKHLRGKQTVRVIWSGNDAKGNAYQRRASDIKANSYPHKYGATIKYNLKISIPYAIMIKRFKYNTTKHSATVSLYREPQH